MVSISIWISLKRPSAHPLNLFSHHRILKHLFKRSDTIPINQIDINFHTWMSPIKIKHNVLQTRIPSSPPIWQSNKIFHRWQFFSLHLARLPPARLQNRELCKRSSPRKNLCNHLLFPYRSSERELHIDNLLICKMSAMPLILKWNAMKWRTNIHNLFLGNWWFASATDFLGHDHWLRLDTI